MTKSFKIQETSTGTKFVTVPSFVASQLGLAKGTKVEFYLDGDRVYMKKV